jgi:type IV secretion system protein VirB5
MNKVCSGLCVGVVSAMVLCVAPAQAQFAVIDVNAIVRLAQQVELMTQQLTTLQAHLRQAQQAYESITGGRGMELLLSGVVRNYLPADWAALQAAVNQTSAAYGVLSAAIQTAIRANAVLSDKQLAVLSPVARNQLLAARRSAATLQALSQQALESTSQRFSALQSLINALAGAKDSKAVMDLQARIQAEQSMLQNDQTKLQVLFEATRGEELAWQQRTREQVMADVGSLRSLPPMGL